MSSKEKLLISKSLHLASVIAIVIGLGILLLCYVFSTINLEDIDDTSIVLPYEVTQIDEHTNKYVFDCDDLANYECLSFYSTHQYVYVYNNRELIFSFSQDGGAWTKTTGSSYHFVNIAGLTGKICVFVTEIYDISYQKPTFFVGKTDILLLNIIRRSLPKFVASLFIVAIAIAMIVYYFLTSKNNRSNQDMFYLSIFSFAMGIWSTNETDISSLVIRNKIMDSMVPYITIMLLVPPFIMFIRGYLNLKDKYFYKIILLLCNLEFVGFSILHFTHILEYRESLFYMQLTLLLSAIYMIVTIVIMLIRKEYSRRLQICVIGLVLFTTAMISDFITYYRTSSDADVFGRYMYLIFMLLLAWDISQSTNEIIEKGKRVKQLEAFAITDQMTGLFNRNAYETHLEGIRNPEDITVVLFDLNNLKFTNDNYGHEVGDEYITTASKIISDIFGPHGNCYRIGGDEFCCIIQSKMNVNMDKLIRHLRAKTTAASAMGSSSLKIDIAIGYARFDQFKDRTVSDIIKRADELMYANKKKLKGI